MNRSAFWKMEEQFWKAGAAFFATNLAPDALMAFPRPAGILDKATAVSSVAGAPRWASVHFDQPHLIEPHPDTTVLCYAVRADRGTPESSYHALASSVYVRSNDNGWKLAFHQQTPLD